PPERLQPIRVSFELLRDLRIESVRNHKLRRSPEPVLEFAQQLLQLLHRHLLRERGKHDSRFFPIVNKLGEILGHLTKLPSAHESAQQTGRGKERETVPRRRGIDDDDVSLVLVFTANQPEGVAQETHLLETGCAVRKLLEDRTREHLLRENGNRHLLADERFY